MYFISELLMSNTRWSWNPNF